MPTKVEGNTCSRRRVEREEKVVDVVDEGQEKEKSVDDKSNRRLPMDKRCTANIPDS